MHANNKTNLVYHIAFDLKFGARTIRFVVVERDSRTVGAASNISLESKAESTDLLRTNNRSVGTK